MFFGSKYIYKYDHSSDESISDDEDDVKLEKQEEGAGAGAATESKGKRKKHLRKADTNVLSVQFNRLLQPGEMHAGDAVACTECKAMASHLTKLQIEENQETKWQCEFCSKINIVDFEQTDLPKQEDATYLLAPAPSVHGSDMTGVDDSIVIFLIDISGSMSSTTLVPGNFRLPNALKQQERDAANFDGERMMRQRNQTYVTRLQGVQMAVDGNLDKLAKDTPTRRAALLTFNHEITYYGDGTRTEPLVIRGDKLNSTEELIHEAEREQMNELKSVAETKTNLTERVYDLEEGGQTALGPAVLFALNIAAKRPGSKLVICTDGLANRGLGNLELAQDEKAEEAVKLQALTQGNQYYAGLTERAREKGVSISVITIKGTTCLLPVIGQMADGSGGNVTIVDLLNIRDEFASVLEQKVIATNVEATVIVHRGLYIRNPDNPDDKLEQITRSVGNVTKQTEISFEFGIRNKQDVKDKYNIDLDQVNQLPFQVQVTYTDIDGNKALRVLTQLKETTENREVAEVNAYRGIIAQNHIRSTATEMMIDYDDEDDEAESSRVRSKWSKPIMQRQRMTYMDNLNARKRTAPMSQQDQFNEDYWHKASNDMNSHVNRSRAVKKSAAQQQQQGSIFSRLSTGLFGSRSEASANAESDRAAKSKRSFGFATRNVQWHTDKTSEDLYRYKNTPADFMSSAPTQNDEEKNKPSSSVSNESTKPFETKPNPQNDSDSDSDDES